MRDEDFIYLHKRLSAGFKPKSYYQNVVVKCHMKNSRLQSSMYFLLLRIHTSRRGLRCPQSQKNKKSLYHPVTTIIPQVNPSLLQ